jgi:hypothetical protein
VRGIRGDDAVPDEIRKAKVITPDGERVVILAVEALLHSRICRASPVVVSPEHIFFSTFTPASPIFSKSSCG